METVKEAVIEILKIYEQHPTWTNVKAIQARADVFQQALESLARVYEEVSDVKVAIEKIQALKKKVNEK